MASGWPAVGSPLSAVGRTDAQEIAWLDFDTLSHRAEIK